MPVSKSHLLPTCLQGVTPKHASAALRWFESMRAEDEWGLTTDDQIQLLGGVKKRTFQQWKKKALMNEPVELNRDIMERFSLLVGIYQDLKIIAPAGQSELGVRWFSTPNSNPLFGGVSPKQFALQVGTIESLYAVRRYLHSARR